MLCRSTPAAPALAHTFSQAAANVAGAHTLSIRLYQRPPLTPFSSADTMRSVHTEASTHDQSRASAPCLAFTGTAGALPCLIANFPPPPSCPAFPRPGFAVRASRGLRHCGTMRALTPAALSQARQVSLLPSLRLQGIPPPTTWCARTPLCQSPQRVRSVPHGTQASPHMSKLATSPRRIGFVILQATPSPPAAPHSTSRRRSCLRLHGRDITRRGLPPR